MSTGCAAWDIPCTPHPELLADISWAREQPAPFAVGRRRGRRCSSGPAHSGFRRGLRNRRIIGKGALETGAGVAPRLRGRVAALHGFVVPLERRGPTVDAARLSFLANACRDHDGVRFMYHDRTGASSTRSVEPHRLVHTGYRRYLAAWAPTRNDWRTFRVDRVQGKLRTSLRFKPRKEPEGGFAA